MILLIEARRLILCADFIPAVAIITDELALFLFNGSSDPYCLLMTQNSIVFAGTGLKALKKKTSEKNGTIKRASGNNYMFSLE